MEEKKDLKYDNFLLSQKHTNFKKNYFKKEEEKPKKNRNRTEPWFGLVFGLRSQKIPNRTEPNRIFYSVWFPVLGENRTEQNRTHP